MFPATTNRILLTLAFIVAFGFVYPYAVLIYIMLRDWRKPEPKPKEGRARMFELAEMQRQADYSEMPFITHLTEEKEETKTIEFDVDYKKK